MKAFEALMRTRDVPFDHNNNCIMCFPHIINICTTHTVESLTDPALADEQTDFDAIPFLGGMEQDYRQAVEHNPIALCCCIVQAIRASGKCCDDFQEIICTGNEEGWFDLPELQLLHDVKTHWDSMFLMICHFHTLQPISNLELLFAYILTIYE